MPLVAGAAKLELVALKRLEPLSIARLVPLLLGISACNLIGDVNSLDFHITAAFELQGGQLNDQLGLTEDCAPLTDAASASLTLHEEVNLAAAIEPLQGATSLTDVAVQSLRYQVPASNTLGCDPDDSGVEPRDLVDFDSIGVFVGPVSAVSAEDAVRLGLLSPLPPTSGTLAIEDAGQAALVEFIQDPAVSFQLLLVAQTHFSAGDLAPESVGALSIEIDAAISAGVEW